MIAGSNHCRMLGAVHSDDWAVLGLGRLGRTQQGRRFPQKDSATSNTIYIAFRKYLELISATPCSQDEAESC